MPALLHDCVKAMAIYVGAEVPLFLFDKSFVFGRYINNLPLRGVVPGNRLIDQSVDPWGSSVWSLHLGNIISAA